MENSLKFSKMSKMEMNWNLIQTISNRSKILRCKLKMKRSNNQSQKRKLSIIIKRQKKETKLNNLLLKNSQNQTRILMGLLTQIKFLTIKRPKLSRSGI